MYINMERGQVHQLYDLNHHHKQERINFREEGHVYNVDVGGSGKFSSVGWTSASSLPKPFFKPFNSGAIVDGMIARGLSGGKYEGMERADILKMWDDNGNQASAAGTKFHLYAEKLTNGAVERIAGATGAYDQLHHFMDDYEHLEPFLTEPLLYIQKYMLTGSPDILYWAQEQKDDGDLHLIIGDYKNSKKINTSGFRGDRCLGRLSHLQDCNWVKYCLQLNTYKKMLEDSYTDWVVRGKKYNKVVIDGMFLIVCHDTQSEYKTMVVPSMTYETQLMFNARAQELIGGAFK